MNKPNIEALRAEQTSWLQQYYGQVSPKPKFIGPVFRTAAILCADDDGGRALGELNQGNALPKAPWLASPDGSRNYVQDWIDLANDQLHISGARFRIGDPLYTLVKNTALNSINCSHGAYADSYASQPQNKNIFDYNLVLIFRWGADPNTPDGQACTTANYIQMPYYNISPRWIDGKQVIGNCQFTHELGHYMGLAHTHDAVINPIWYDADAINASGGIGNPHLYPLKPDFLQYMNGVTAVDLTALKASALQTYATWGGNTDYDSDYGVHDTPADLGVGLPLVMGDFACTGQLSYQLKRYPSLDVHPVYDANGNISGYTLNSGVPDSDQHLETVIINDVIRLNIMSYWFSNQEGMIFSSDQVKVMNGWLDDPSRSNKYDQKTVDPKQQGPPAGEGPPKTAKWFRYNPMSPTEVANIANTLQRENTKAYSLQFERIQFPTCGVLKPPRRTLTAPIK